MVMTAGEQGSRGAVFFIFLQILYDGQSTGFDITKLLTSWTQPIFDSVVRCIMAIGDKLL